MKQEPEKYYLLFESWSLDATQWSMVMDSSAVLLAVFGVLLGFYMYRKQRSDNAKDAFDYFQASLPELIQSIEKAITDLKEFNQSLDLDNFVHPIISAELNDKFLSKINIVHLNRFYSDNRPEKLSNFRQLLVDSNFFGNYHNYISKEIDFFRTSYQKEKSTYLKWRQFRSDNHFADGSTNSENSQYNNFYTQWAKDFNQKLGDFKSNAQTKGLDLKRREALIDDEMKDLTENMKPFIKNNPKANKTTILAHDITTAKETMMEMKTKITAVLKKDIAKFEDVLSNMKQLLEDGDN